MSLYTNAMTHIPSLMFKKKKKRITKKSSNMLLDNLKSKILNFKVKKKHYLIYLCTYLNHLYIATGQRF